MNTRPVIYSTSHATEIEDRAIPDIDIDETFLGHFEIARNYSMTSKPVLYALYQAARYVADRGIAGDFVECGVWRGGSSLLAALTFRGIEGANRYTSTRFPFTGRRRDFWLYDTYEGMTLPSDLDVDLHGNQASKYMEKYSDNGKWCYADFDDVKDAFVSNGFTGPEIRMVKGDVLETLKVSGPKEISILRLDTDWYESTKMEMEVLYPRLVRGGVLIIDDYGHWKGSRQAVDEYFTKVKRPLLHRVSNEVRMAIKT